MIEVLEDGCSIQGPSHALRQHQVKRRRGKFDVQWPGPYLVEGYAGEHQTSYHPKHFHEKRHPGAHHGNHLRLYQPRTGFVARPFGRGRSVGPRAVRELRARAAQRDAIRARCADAVLPGGGTVHPSALDLSRLGIEIGRAGTAPS